MRRSFANLIPYTRAKVCVFWGIITLNGGWCWAVDESRLWLPVKYHALYIQLKQAAEAAEAIERCVTVLKGSIDLSQSSPGHPIYRIQCRQENGLSYNEMVDGISFETLTTPKIVIIPPTPEELEQQRIAEEERIRKEREERKTEYWKVCKAALQEETRYMSEIKWLTEDPEPEPFTDEVAIFTLDFDAEDINAKPLQYRARCTIWAIDNCKIDIRKRRDKK